MFEDTVLRLSDKERQQQLAELEQQLAQRRAALEARNKNLAYRLDWMKKEPAAVSQAVEREDHERKEEKRMAREAREIKARFGLGDRELIDTAGMRGALEQALAEKDVDQQMQADRITDRASLLSGLNRLALIDAAKAGEILHANKDLNPPREYTHQEVAEMFAKAQSHFDKHGRKHNYAKTLDGWAQSLEARKRELDLAEIKLDAKEQALRAQVERTLGALKEKEPQQQPGVPERAAGVQAQPQPAAGKSAEAAASEMGAGPRTAGRALDTSLEVLNDPAKFEATVVQAARESGVSVEQMRVTLEGLRDTRNARATAEPSKADIEAAKQQFFARGEAIASGNVVDIDSRRDGASAPANGRASGNATVNGAGVGRADAAQQDGTKARPRAELGIEGFRSLNRNRTRSAAENSPQAAQEAQSSAAARTTRTATQESDRAATRDGRATAAGSEKAGQDRQHVNCAAGGGEGEGGKRRHFRELNAHERMERRAVFFGDLREAAGFTRDGKEALSEKAKEAVRPGKQRDGYGVGS